MSTPYRIVIGFDFSDLARAAFAEAVALGRGQKEPELHLVTVVDSDASELIPTEDRHQSLVQITDHVRERLIAEAGRLLPGEGGPLRTIGHVRVGSIADEIVSLATEVRADLLVLGTHGRRGVRRLIMGSVAERSARMAPMRRTYMTSQTSRVRSIRARTGCTRVFDIGGFLLAWGERTSHFNAGFWSVRHHPRSSATCRPFRVAWH